MIDSAPHLSRSCKTSLSFAPLTVLNKLAVPLSHFTLWPSGFTYFARDPKQSWFHEHFKKWIHFSNINTCHIPHDYTRNNIKYLHVIILHHNKPSVASELHWLSQNTYGLLIFLVSRYCKQYGRKSDCSIWTEVRLLPSSLIRIHIICSHDKI